MNLTYRLLFIIFLIIISALYVFPWDKYGYTLPTWVKPYKLGLDLHGGVELDYSVDLSAVRSQTGGHISETSVTESLKNIIDKRVQSLGLEEPTIQTAQYGPGQTHLIVQIPVRDYGNISEEEKRIRNEEDIEKAKETIGKVVQIEFREKKTDITEEDRQFRRDIAEAAYTELKSTPFSTVGAKYRDQYENVFYVSTSGALLPEAKFPGHEDIKEFPFTSPVTYIEGAETIGLNASGTAVTQKSPGGYAIVLLESLIADASAEAGTGSVTSERQYKYSVIYFSELPSEWMPAKTADGRVLNDKYVTRAGMVLSPTGVPQVELIFNSEGAQIFGEITKRLLGQQIAIFIGSQNLAAPTVQDVIADGKAVITGSYTIQSAQELANNINTGIVPAPIYLTSERTIDAKIGRDSLGEILNAALIGLGGILLLLVYFYRVSGFLAGVALVFYTILLVALVKAVGVTLTLASIAGVILSIGMAIDANILIFERMKEAMRSGLHSEKAVIIGFGKSWTAIWASHVTSLISAIVLYIFGVSLIKGFGLMLGLGIVLSLFTAMWVSRILVLSVSRTKIGKDTKLFVGLKD